MNTSKSSIFYGWIIVAAVFVIGGTAAGLIYSFPAFFDSISEAFGASRAQVSMIFAASEFVWFMTGFGAGYLADRFGPRIVVFVGSLFMASGLFVAGLSGSMTQLVLAYAIGVGVGGGLMYIPSVSLVQRWFKRNRGLASGLAICGPGVGTLLFPYLGASLVESYGWVNAHFSFAAIAVIVCGGASLFLIASPALIGAFPDGDPGTDAPGTDPNLRGIALGEALKMRVFWYVYIASLCTSAAAFTTYVHMVPYSIDSGNSTSESIALIGILGVSSIVGRFMFGGLSDRFGGRKTIVLMFFGIALALLWWLLAPPSLLNMWFYAFLFGAFYGGYIAILPVLLMSHFGGYRISSIIGALYTSWGVGALLGPTFAGYVFDISGSYFYAILVIMVLVVVSALSCLRIGEPSQNY